MAILDAIGKGILWAVAILLLDLVVACTVMGMLMG